MLPLRILLAEDSVINQKLAVGLLERGGHRVVVVTNGPDAVQATAQEPFDLVLMDLQMPELDGLAATAAIRQREKQSGGHVPIIAMTAHALKGDRERCLAAGMDGYVPKPVRLNELYQAIADVCGPQRGSVDWNVALDCVEGDRALLADVAAAFLVECPQRLAELREAIAKCDSPRVCREAHTLKSALNALGAFAAASLAAHLEQQGALNDLSSSRQTTEQLAAKLDDVLNDVATRAGV
jgi:CheY-like chemotaxis protein